MTLKHTLLASALTVSALFTLTVAGQSVSNPTHLSTTPVTVQARRRYRRHYRKPARRRTHRARRIANRYGYWKHYWKHGRKHAYYYRYKSGYFHGNRWVSYHKPAKARRHYAKAKVTHKSVNSDPMNDSGYIGNDNSEPTANQNAHQLSEIQSGVQNYQSQQSVQPSTDDQSGEVDANIVEQPSQTQQNQQLADIQAGVREPYQANYKVQPTYAQELPANHASQPVNEQTTDQATDNAGQSQRQVPYENNWEVEMSARTIQDINNDRAANGVQPLTEDPALDDIGQYRAEQKPTSHYNNQGQVENAVVAVKLGYSPYYEDKYGENILSNETNIGKETNFDSKKTPESISAADWSEDALVNHDEDSDNGHRDNILCTSYQKVGVGVHTYTDRYGGNNYSLVEEFQ